MDDPTRTPTLRGALRRLHALTRLGLSLGVIILLGGYGVSGYHLQTHYDARDERAGFTLDDIRAAYHGISSPSPMVEAIEQGHPEGMADADRETLLDWLASDGLDRAYDDLDLGDEAPSEIIAVACLDCHSRGATSDGAYPQLPLEYWDDVRSVAYSTDIAPAPIEILAVSQHTHAPTMSTILLVLVVMAGMSRWPGAMVGSLAALGGAGLLADLGAQWLARASESWAVVIVGGGVVYAGSVGLLGLLILIDLWSPIRKT